jgi:hypothetical protein
MKSLPSITNIMDAVGAAPPRAPGRPQALGKRPPLLLLADEDCDGELLLPDELGRELEGLATVSGLEAVAELQINCWAGQLKDSIDFFID